MFWNRLCAAFLQILFPVKFLFVETCLTEQTQFKSAEAFEAGLLNRYNNKLFLRTTILIQVVCRWLLSLTTTTTAIYFHTSRPRAKWLSPTCSLYPPLFPLSVFYSSGGRESTASPRLKWLKLKTCKYHINITSSWISSKLIFIVSIVVWKSE